MLFNGCSLMLISSSLGLTRAMGGGAAMATGWLALAVMYSWRPLCVAATVVRTALAIAVWFVKALLTRKIHYLFIVMIILAT